MTDTVPKLSHKEWRREAKKCRRKRIRQQMAIRRKEEEKEREKSPSYALEIEKKRLYEEYEMEKEARQREELHLKWLEEEERAQKRWREEQKLKELALEEKLKEQERLRKEWEKEQKKIKEQKEKLEALRREEEKRRQETLERINDFISNGGDVPAELLTVTETNPGKENCSFYDKVGACRFGNQCSRNHQYYKISNVLVFLNFYTHFTLDQSRSSEYDTDITLEYEDSDMYMHFRDFYNDIVPELKRFGDVKMVKVCCNTEFHLRGNVYVEYKTDREALIAYKSFQGRWYGGKQLNLEFVRIRDWGSAICGDFARRRCPKGKSCNFLHVFRNPKNEYALDWNKHRHTNSTRDSFDENDNARHTRHWRWSETPELSPERVRSRHVSGSRKRKRERSRSVDEKKRKKMRHDESHKKEKRKRSCVSDTRSKKTVKEPD